MAYEGIIFAVIAAVGFGVLSLSQNQASAHVSPLLAAFLISGSALIIEIAFLAPQAGSIRLPEQKYILILAVAGLSAFVIDFFAVKAYGSGVQLSIGAPIIFGGGIAIASMLGLFVLGESITLMKLLGIALVVAGASILASL